MSEAPRCPTLRVGRYELLEEVGRVRAATLHKGYDPDEHRFVLLEILETSPTAPVSESETVAQRFLERARLAQRLSHPGIATVLEAGRDPDARRLFVALKHAEGRTLEQAAAGGPLPWRRALGIVGRVAAALHYAHGEGVIHGALDPSAILLVPSGEPRILGLAAAAVETGGTPLGGLDPPRALYAPPERARGEALEAAADVFSLGAVAYRLLTGVDAFAATDLPGILARVVEQDPPPPSHLAGPLPAELDRVLARALAKSKEGRYRDAHSFAEDLERLRAATQPLPGSEPDPIPRLILTGTEKFPHGETTAVLRRPLTRAVAGLLALGLVAALEVARRGSEPLPPEPPLPASSSEASPPAPAPTLPARSPEPPSSAQKAAPSPDPVASARLVIDFRHGFKKGALALFVDDRKVLQQALSSRVVSRFLTFERRRGRVYTAVTVPPGVRRVRVEVTWEDQRRSRSIVGSFKEGATRRIVAKVGLFARGFSLDWE